MTLYPTPEITLNMPTPAFHKYRRALAHGLYAYRQSRIKRKAMAERVEMEAAKMARFVRNCAINGRVHGMEWN